MGIFDKLVKKADEHELVAEIPLEGEDSTKPDLLIYGYDSCYKESAPVPNLYVRRYDVCLQFASREGAEAFVANNGGNPQAIQMNNQIKLVTLAGDTMKVAESLEVLNGMLQESGCTVLPIEETYNAIATDIGKHSHKYGEPVQSKKRTLF